MDERRNETRRIKEMCVRGKRKGEARDGDGEESKEVEGWRG